MSSELIKRLEALLESGKSRRQIARESGLTDITIRRILAGNNVAPSTAEKLAEYLRLPVARVYKMAGLLPNENDMSEEERRKRQLIEQIMEVWSLLPLDDVRRLQQLAMVMLEEQRKK